MGSATLIQEGSHRNQTLSLRSQGTECDNKPVCFTRSYSFTPPRTSSSLGNLIPQGRQVITWGTKMSREIPLLGACPVPVRMALGGGASTMSPVCLAWKRIGLDRGYRIPEDIGNGLATTGPLKSLGKMGKVTG